MRKEGGENYIRTSSTLQKKNYGDNFKQMGWAGYEAITIQMINDMNTRQHLSDVYVDERIILNKIKISLFTSWRHTGSKSITYH